MDNLYERRPRFDWTLLWLLLLSVVGYILIHDLLGTSLIGASPYNSYTLQAMAWREGRFYLAENYSWLELAVYNGNYYVSFPPVPSVVVLPLTFIFGYGVPTNLVIMVYALTALVLAYRLAVRFGLSRGACAFFAAFVVYGSNMFWMSTQGAVWFEAQLLNLVFCLGAACAAAANRRYVSMTLLALAVGCRPFSLVFFPFLMAVFYKRDRGADPSAKS